MATARATKPAPAPDLTTPGDDAQPKPAASHPTKGRRYRLLGKAEGDFCIYQIAPSDGPLPKGCLIPIPDVPRFATAVEAKAWADNESGDLLAGKQVMVFMAVGIANIEVAHLPVVKATWKPKIQISGPETEEAGL